jgi:Mrp family chromosome partitioning ATPase
MGGGRAKLPVLAEISGPAPTAARVFSLRRADFEALSAPLEQLAERRVVLVSGNEALAGVLAVALAGAAAATGRRTILLECDLARPRLAGELGLADEPGLHEYLRWETTAPEILQALVLGGAAARRAAAPLICIAGGRPASDPATLLGLESFRHAIAKLRSAYELVVLSGPALGAERAALDSAAAQADAVLLGASAAQVSGRPGRALRAAARSLPRPPLGAVVVGES